MIHSRNIDIPRHAHSWRHYYTHIPGEHAQGIMSAVIRRQVAKNLLSPEREWKQKDLI
ncbi:hypothetical protein YTPLAS18_02190 [Nitrospira sp.]|nr:hypothetical protein YTPLAS18_02190 [Nitrospira sp.]